jgi:hypothetical protein
MSNVPQNASIQTVTASQLNVARRRFLQTAMAGAGLLGLSSVGLGAKAATAVSDIPPTQGLRSGKSNARDQDILNFALNLEYLEAEFYLLAATGAGLTPADAGSDLGPIGATTGGRQVTFATPLIAEYAREIAADELAHVRLLRAVTAKSVAKPAIDLSNSFTAAARALGLVSATETFDAFANENNFLLASYIFEDVGVTAYKGAAKLINNGDILEAAAGLLAVEAYHSGLLRGVLSSRRDLVANAGSTQPPVTIGQAANAISDFRDSVDGSPDLDQGIVNPDGTSNIVPTDANGLAFSRTPGQVLAITYFSKSAESGGFFPAGINGRIK